MRKIIITERLYLRELNVADYKYFYNLNLDTDVLKYTGDEPFINLEDAKKFLKNYKSYKKYGFGRWAVITTKDDRFLGWCGIKFTENLNEYDIGFRFFKKYWGNGFATESAKSCIEYGINNLKINEIVGRAMKENKASIRVLEKIGLEYNKDIDFDGNKGVLYKTT